MGYPSWKSLYAASMLSACLALLALAGCSPLDLIPPLRPLEIMAVPFDEALIEGENTKLRETVLWDKPHQRIDVVAIDGEPPYKPGEKTSWRRVSMPPGGHTVTFVAYGLPFHFLPVAGKKRPRRRDMWWSPRIPCELRFVFSPGHQYWIGWGEELWAYPFRKDERKNFYFYVRDLTSRERVHRENAAKACPLPDREPSLSG